MAASGCAKIVLAFVATNDCALLGIAAALAALDHQRVQGHVGVRGAVERAGAEVPDDLIEVFASSETWL